MVLPDEVCQPVVAYLSRQAGKDVSAICDVTRQERSRLLDLPLTQGRAGSAGGRCGLQHRRRRPNSMETGFPPSSHEYETERRR
jgi:hypothetical protein